MHKVVYNNCYGGFSLSNEAVYWLLDNAADDILKEYIKQSIDNTLSRYLGMVVADWFCNKRHHHDLIAVVETLGNKANGECANLAIAEISSNQYRIEQYDGAEDVITPNDNHDWIFITG